MKPSKRKPSYSAEDDEPVHLTADGLKRLQERLARLKKAMPELASEAGRTAAYGDRSDNAEYKEAKRQLRRMHGQIFSIEDQLRRAVVIKSGKNSAGTIRIGSVVVVERAGARKTFEIVGPNETDPAKGRISHKSPLGETLIGHKEKDVVKIKTATGSQEYKILKVD